MLSHNIKTRRRCIILVCVLSNGRLLTCNWCNCTGGSSSSISSATRASSYKQNVRPGGGRIEGDDDDDDEPTGQDFELEMYELFI